MIRSKYNLTKEQKKLLRDFFAQENDGTDYELTCADEMTDTQWKELEKLGKYNIKNVDDYLDSIYSRTERGKIEFRLEKEGKLTRKKQD